MKVVFFILGIVLLIVILLLLLKPTFKIMLVISERTKSAYYSVKGAGLSLTKGKIILLSSGEISIVDKKSVILSRRLPKKLSKILASNMIDVVGLESYEVFISGGKKDSPFLTATASGIISAVLGMVGAPLSFDSSRSNFDVRTDFKADKFTIGVISKIRVSVLDMLVVFIKSISKYKKEIKLEEKYGKTETISG